MSYLVAALSATILLLIIALQNPAPVAVRFLFWQAQAPLALLVVVATVIGAALAVAGGMPSRIRTGKRLREAEHEVAALTDELTQLRQRAAAPASPSRQNADMPLPGQAEAAAGLKEQRQ